MNRTQGIIKDIMVSLTFGGGLAVVGYLCFDYGYQYVDTLANSWVIFAGWLPIIMLSLSILITTSDREFIVKTHPAKVFESLIDVVKISAFFIVVAIVTLFLFRSLAAEQVTNGWIVTASVVAGGAVSYIFIIFGYLIKLAKAIAQVEQAHSDK